MTVESSLHGADAMQQSCDECCRQCDCEFAIAGQVAPHPGLFALLREDVQTVFIKDPAARGALEVLTCYPGLHAIWGHRIAHALWRRRLYFLARLISHVMRWLTGIEVHPGAQIGRRFFIDHGMGVVIGETAEIGNDVLMYKGVVLGGVSLERVKRHPTIGDGVVLGSNAVVLGPIVVGSGSKIGSGSVVVKPVPTNATVVGVPGRVVKRDGVACPRLPDLHHEQLPDMVVDRLEQMSSRIAELEAKMQVLGQEAQQVFLPVGHDE